MNNKNKLCLFTYFTNLPSRGDFSTCCIDNQNISVTQIIISCVCDDMLNFFNKDTKHHEFSRFLWLSVYLQHAKNNSTNICVK